MKSIFVFTLVWVLMGIFGEAVLQIEILPLGMLWGALAAQVGWIAVAKVENV